MKKKESLVTTNQFRQGLAKLEGKLGIKIGGVEKGLVKLEKKIDNVEKKLDSKIDGVEKRLDDKIDGVEKRLNQKIVGVDGKIDRLEMKIEDKAQKYHNQILDRLDEIMVEVKASREERVVVTSARVSDHETRLGKIEGKVFPESGHAVPKS